MMTETSLPSVRYWDTSDEKKDQRFYTAFSLLGVAITNYSTGKSINRNLSWVNIAYYYSMVFSLRSILFLAVGDFPTSHVELIKSVSSQPQKRRSRNGRLHWVYRYNWLKKFLDSQTANQYNIIDKSLISTNNLVERLQMFTRENHREQCSYIVSNMGRILNRVRLIRNDENYESLISFHHVYHQFVTPRVEELRNKLRIYALEYLGYAIEFFADYIYDHCRKDYFLDFLNYTQGMEGLPYLYYSLRESDLLPLIKDDILPIFRENKLTKRQIDKMKAQIVLNHISRQVFSSKSKLQQSFASRVNRIARISETPSIKPFFHRG